MTLPYLWISAGKNDLGEKPNKPTTIKNDLRFP